MHFTLPLSGQDDCLASSIELRRTFSVKKLLRVFADHVFGRPAVNFFRALVPEQDVVIEIAHQDRVLCLVQQLGLLANLLFSAFTLGDVTTNRDVLVGFAFAVEKGDDSRVNPIEAAVLGAVFYLTTPNFAARYRGPKVSDELFRMIRGVDNAVVLTE